jgi:ERCC4-type nuclease
MVKAKPVKPVKEKPVKQIKVKPVKEKPVKPAKTKPVKQVKAKPIKPVKIFVPVEPAVNPLHKFNLIVDERERAVHKYSFLWEDIKWTKTTITVGDYAIVLNDVDGSRILFTIERKSLQDFAASFKDGRYNNKDKLKYLQDRTGCRVMFIIEGPRIINPKKFVGGIMYKNIESSIMHMEMQYKWCFHYTTNEMETAQFLERLVHSMYTLHANGKLPMNELQITKTEMVEVVDEDQLIIEQIIKMEQNIKNEVNIDVKSNTTETVKAETETVKSGFDTAVTNSVDTTELDTTEVDTAEVDTVEADTVEADKYEDTVEPLNVNELLKFNFVKSDESVVREMWAALSGITVETADVFMKYSLKEIIYGDIPADTLKNMKYATGRAVAKRTLNRLVKLSNDDQAKLLGKIPGLSGNAANFVLAEVNLKKLLDPEFDLDQIRYFGDKKINKKVQDGIRKYFYFKKT